MLPALVSLAVGLVLPTTRYSLPASRAAGIPSMCADADSADAKINEAAARVLEAAKLFGDVQVEAATAWVQEALDARSGAADPSMLLEKQQDLFDECLLEESGKCKELDQALTALETELKQEDSQDNGAPSADFSSLFRKSKLDRASARVRTAAAYFGDEQARVTALWVTEVRKNKSLDPFALLEQQVAVFDECMVGDTDRCKELEEALGALQASLGVRGKIVPTGGLSSIPKDEGAPSKK